jgi:Holliday junction resolvase
MPLYETEQDRSREREVATRLEKWGRCKLLKLGTKAGIDFVAVRDGEIVAAFEVKCRRDPSDAFDSVWIETAKVDHLAQVANLFEVPAFFVVRWSDGVIHFVEASDVPELSGAPKEVDRTRNPRGDEHDRDFVYLCPLEGMGVV